MKYRNLDPKKIKTRFKSSCNKCGVSLLKGVDAYYFPIGRHIYCIPCGHPSYQSFLESVADEEIYNM